MKWTYNFIDHFGIEWLINQSNDTTKIISQQNVASFAPYICRHLLKSFNRTPTPLMITQYNLLLCQDKHLSYVSFKLIIIFSSLIHPWMYLHTIFTKLSSYIFQDYSSDMTKIQDAATTISKKAFTKQQRHQRKFKLWQNKKKGENPTKQKLQKVRKGDDAYPMLASSGIDALNPKGTHIPLLVAAVSVGVLKCLLNSFSCYSYAVFGSSSKPFS